MMRDMIAVIKKEMHRFFHDKRMVLSTVILPGILIYVVYSIMGTTLMSQNAANKDYLPIVYTINSTVEIDAVMDAMPFIFKHAGEEDINKIKSEITNKKADCLVCFPDNFNVVWSGEQIITPNVEVYFNSVSQSSYNTYTTIINALNAFESSIVNLFDINMNEASQYDLATEKDASVEILSSFLPMILIMLLFSGCIAVAPDAIAGEKDRGTIATLMVTPLSRNSFAVGKVISLSVFALLNGVSSFIGTVLAIPKMFSDTIEISASVYGIKEYAYLLLVICASVLFIISVLSIISAISKTAKEAASMCSPLMIGATLLGTITNMQFDMSATAWRVVPVLNSILCINDILEFNIVPANIIITCISNIIYTVILTYVLTKLLNNEKIVFTK